MRGEPGEGHCQLLVGLVLATEHADVDAVELTEVVDLEHPPHRYVDGGLQARSRHPQVERQDGHGLDELGASRQERRLEVAGTGRLTEPAEDDVVASHGGGRREHVVHELARRTL